MDPSLAFGEWPPSLRGTANAPMTVGNISHLLGNNRMDLYLIDAGAKAATEGFNDPWGNPYRVDFSQTQTPGEDVYEACVAFPLQRRHKYEDM